MLDRERDAWTWLASVEGVTPARFRRLLEFYGNAQEVRRSFDIGARGILGDRAYLELAAARTDAYFDALMDTMRKSGMQAVCTEDPTYPPLLVHIGDPPPVLFVRGSADLSDARTVAVVGSRRATRYGLRQAERFGRELARAGVTVVSGMARGTDTAAHVGCLSGGGRTIAVLGCGVDVVYPPENRELFARVIGEGGSIISEFAPGTGPLAQNFPRRNRIISGMCVGVLVTEAARGSGAMITVQHALDQGREVFAMPGPVDAPMSEMPLQLLFEGACLARGADDILGHLQWDMQAPDEAPDDMPEAAPQLDPDEQKIVQLLENEPLSFDQLLVQTGFSPDKLNMLLTTLEIKEIMKQLPGCMYVLERSSSHVGGVLS